MIDDRSVYCCKKVSFGDYFHIYSIFLNLRAESKGVSAIFGVEAIGHLIEHCQQEGTSVGEPKDLEGLLFEVKLKGNALSAIRIHPAYGKKMSWLRTGICTMDAKERDRIAEYLSIIGEGKERMISGGEHIEHPIEYDPYIVEGEEMEREVEREYEEWMWKQVLDEGPPQDDNTMWLKQKWLKQKAWKIGYQDGSDDISPDEADEQLYSL